MADAKITQLTELTTPVGSDLLVIVDDPGGTPITKKVTVTNLLTLAAGGSGFFPAFTTPVDGDFAWINQDATIVTVNGNGGICLSGTSGAGGNNEVALRKKAAPSVPYTVTAAILGLKKGAPSFGLCFREVASGELHTFGAGFSGVALSSSKWDSPTAFSAHYAQTPMEELLPASGGLMWLRIADDNTNRVCSWSADGYNFFTFHSVTRTDFLTANEVGFYVSSANATDVIALTLMSWDEA